MHIQCNGTPPGHRTSPGMNSSPAAHRPAEDDKLTRDRTKSTEQERSTPSGIVNDAHRDRNARQGGVHGAGVRRSSKRELELASCGSLPPFENLQARCSRLTWRVAPRASAEGRAQRGASRRGRGRHGALPVSGRDPLAVRVLPARAGIPSAQAAGLSVPHNGELPQAAGSEWRRESAASRRLALTLPNQRRGRGCHQGLPHDQLHHGGSKGAGGKGQASTYQAIVSKSKTMLRLIIVDLSDY